MMGSWVVGAVIRFSSNGGAVMSRLSTSTAMANARMGQLNGTVSASQVRMMRYQQQLDKATEARRRFIAAGAGIGAAIGAAVMVDAVSDAARLQTLLIGVRNATGATRQQMEGLRQSIYDTGDAMGTNVTKMADVYAIIARSSGGVFRGKNGGFDAVGFNQVAPTVAAIAMIQNRTRGVSLDEGAKTTMQLVHLMREYSGEGFQKVADGITRLSEMMPDSLSTALRQMTYFEPAFKTLKISNQDAFATMALLDRMGYGRGKGGTNLADLVQAAIPALQLTAHAQVGKQNMLRQMGLIDNTGRSVFFRDGRGNLFGFLEQLEKFAKGKPSDEIMSLFKSVFGTQGSRIANLALDPAFLKQLPGIERVMKNPNISLNEQVKQYQNSLGFQFQRAIGNLQSVMTELGWPWLQSLTDFFRGLGDNLHGFQKWLNANKNAEKTIGIVFMSLTGMLGLISAAGSVRMIGSLMGATGQIDRLTLAIERLGVASAAAGGEAAAAGTEARVASVGIRSLVLPLTLLYGVVKLYQHAIDEHNRRVSNGTAATENQQYRNVYSSNSRNPAFRRNVDQFGTLHLPNGSTINLEGILRASKDTLKLPPPKPVGPVSQKWEQHVSGVTIIINGSPDPKATGEAAAAALNPMHILRTAGASRRTAVTPSVYTGQF